MGGLDDADPTVVAKLRRVAVDFEELRRRHLGAGACWASRALGNLSDLRSILHRGAISDMVFANPVKMQLRDEKTCEVRAKNNGTVRLRSR